ARASRVGWSLRHPWIRLMIDFIARPRWSREIWSAPAKDLVMAKFRSLIRLSPPRRLVLFLLRYPGFTPGAYAFALSASALPFHVGRLTPFTSSQPVMINPPGIINIRNTSDAYAGARINRKFLTTNPKPPIAINTPRNFGK